MAVSCTGLAGFETRGHLEDFIHLERCNYTSLLPLAFGTRHNLVPGVILQQVNWKRTLASGKLIWAPYPLVLHCFVHYPFAAPSFPRAVLPSA